MSSVVWKDFTLWTVYDKWNSIHHSSSMNSLMISSRLLLEWTVRVERAELGQTQWPWAYKKREQPDKVHACVNQMHIRQIRAMLKSRQKVGHL